MLSERDTMIFYEREADKVFDFEVFIIMKKFSFSTNHVDIQISENTSRMNRDPI